MRVGIVVVLTNRLLSEVPTALIEGELRGVVFARLAAFEAAVGLANVLCRGTVLDSVDERMRGMGG
jgi:hypothetical protein